MKINNNLFIAMTLLIAVTFTVLAFAGVPQTINYQGYLKDTATNVPINSPVSITFKLYSTSTGTTPYWSEAKADIKPVDGIFSVQLGTDKNNGLDARHFNSPVYLGITVDPDKEMTRQLMSSSPFAIRAGMADSVAVDSVTNAGISGPINSSKLDLSTVVTKAGDTMSGALNLPLNGLTVGTSQIVTSADKVGIGGTPAGTAKLQVYNTTNSGQSAYFEINNTANVLPAMYGKTNGGGQAVFGLNQGTGRAGHFQIASPASTASALVAETSGTGNAAEILGKMRITGPITSTVATGTAPLTIASTTQVTNLNANLLNGLQASEIITAASDEVRTPISACGITISTAGSYYLTGNLITTGTCIAITSSNVTLDLMGFTLSGNGTVEKNGVDLTSVSNVEIKGGTIRNFNFGIFSNNNTLTENSIRIFNVSAVSNTFDGFRLRGSGIHIKDCISYNNVGFGIYVGPGSIVSNNLVQNNQGTYGIYAGPGSVVSNNSVHNNQSNGIFADSGSTVTNNSTSFNSIAGIITGTGATVTSNTSNNNQHWGIAADSFSKVVGNTLTMNNLGSFAEAGGLRVSAKSMIKDNLVSDNNLNNIVVFGAGSIIEENFVANSTNGIFFNASGNFYNNNRATANGNAYNVNVTSQSIGSNLIF